jgi:ATP-dependent Clp protease protease subunit
MTIPKIHDMALGADDLIGLGLLKSHIHVLHGDIDEDNIAEAIKWVIFENADDKEKTLTLYINSTGGSLCDAFALIDIMRSSKHPIRTIGMGSVMSAAFMIFLAGDKGGRILAKNTSILCHQFSENVEGKYHDLKSSLKENENMNNRMVEFIKECTDLSTRVIKTKLLPPSDVWLTVDEALELGIADHIL